MKPGIEKKIPAIRKFFETQPIEKAWIFGSCARGEETAESDVDLLVKWRPSEYSWKDECALQEFFMKFFGRPVDIVANTALRRNPRFARRVCPEAIAI